MRRKPPGPPVVTEVDGGTITAPDEEAARHAVEHYRAEQAHEGRRRELWGASGAKSMVRLCRRFPSLERVEGAGVGPWDANRVLAWACRPLSRAERFAALFVLNVWNNTTDWNEIAHLAGDDGEPPLLEEEEALPELDIMEAWSTWDLEHRHAALLWFADPFWC